MLSQVIDRHTGKTLSKKEENGMNGDKKKQRRLQVQLIFQSWLTG
jgi:hypothetical protein